MEKDLKVGDKVKIRSDLVVWETYKSSTWDDFPFCSDMEEFLWKVVTVSNFDEADLSFQIEENDNYDWFTDTMIEKKVLENNTKYERKAVRSDGVTFEKNAIWWRTLEDIQKSIQECKESIKRDESLLRAHRKLFSKK